MTISQFHKYIHEATDLYMIDTLYQVSMKGAQFFPIESDISIEDFYLPFNPDMINLDVLSEVSDIADLIKKWRDYNERTREVSVMSDPTIGKD